MGGLPSGSDCVTLVRRCKLSYAVVVTFPSGFVLQFDGSSNLTHRYLHGPAQSGCDEVLKRANDRGTVREAISQGLAAVLTLGVLVGYMMNAPLAGAWKTSRFLAA